MAVAVAAAVALSVSACSGSDAPHSTEGACPESSVRTAHPHGAGDGVGANVRSGDLSLTLTRVFVTSAYLLTDDDVHAQVGCKFVEVSAQGRNEGIAPIAVMCGHRIATSVVTADGRRYGPSPGMDRITGNPTCADRIGAGAGFSATWVFSVPEGARVTRFELRDRGHAPSGTAVRPGGDV